MQDAVMTCGISKPMSQLTNEDKPELLKLLCLRVVLFDAKSAIDQFIEGLDQVRTIESVNVRVQVCSSFMDALAYTACKCTWLLGTDLVILLLYA